MDNKYTNSNINLDEWIRLNNVTEPIIIDAAYVLYNQELELKSCYDMIEDLHSVMDYLDIESIEYELDCLWSDSNKHIKNIQTILDNFKQRKG